MNEMFAKVINDKMIIAPGAITEGETIADGWFPVVDIGPIPNSSETGTPKYFFNGQQVERSWSNIKPKPPERSELLSQNLANALPKLRAYIKASPPTNVHTSEIISLLTETLLTLMIIFGQIPDDQI